MQVFHPKGNKDLIIFKVELFFQNSSWALHSDVIRWCSVTIEDGMVIKSIGSAKLTWMIPLSLIKLMCLVKVIHMEMIHISLMAPVG